MQQPPGAKAEYYFMIDIWQLMAQWAGQKAPALTVTLVNNAGPEGREAGLMAVAERGGSEFLGPLTALPFWADDLAQMADAMALLPETGRRLEIGGRQYYLAPLSYNRSALVLGGGHVGSALCRLLRFLDFDVILMDDRREFLSPRDDGAQTVEAPFAEISGRFSASALDAVVIVTRGHAQDTACLRQVLGWPLFPPYVGMIGSRHRTDETLKMLASEGIAEALLARVHTPVGLKIGAQTPAEIAVSIGAEIIQALAGDRGRAKGEGALGSA